ncbi:hypothetical protein KI387_014940, partial [Taxus chinensis]
YLTDFGTSNRRRLSVHHFPIPESSCTVPDQLVYFQSTPILHSRHRSYTVDADPSLIDADHTSRRRSPCRQ